MIDLCVGHMKVWKPWIPSMHENVNNSVHINACGIGMPRKGTQLCLQSHRKNGD